MMVSMDKEIALFGIASYKCFRMGWGSGDMMAQQISQIVEGLTEAGYKLNGEVKQACEEWIAKQDINYFTVNRNWDEWSFRLDEIEIDEQLIEASSKKSDVAVITLGRCSGEAADLKDEEGFFKLHSEEINLVKTVSKFFDKVVLLLNTCGPLDLTAIDECNVER